MGYRCWHAIQMPRLAGLMASLALGLAGCVTPPPQGKAISHEATAESYAQFQKTKGLVILSVDWQFRHVHCRYFNSVISILGFDRAPLKKEGDHRYPEVTLKRQTTTTFTDYALLLEPGEYALSQFKVLRGLGGKRGWRPFLIGYNSSIPPPRYCIGDTCFLDSPYRDWLERYNRDGPKMFCSYSYLVDRPTCPQYRQLIQDGQVRAGTFRVNAGETVYIGNFSIKCEEEPILRRYYTQKGSDFIHHMERVQQKYPFIDPARVVYRLFETQYLGDPYDPNAPSFLPEPFEFPPKGVRYLERQIPVDRQNTQPPKGNMQYLERETPLEK